MAKVGIKNLTWAKYASGGEGSAITYTGGKYASFIQVPVIPPKYRAGDYVYR